MMIFTLLALALALAMDAFAAAVAQGAAGRHDWAAALRIGAVFGAAQGIMPLLGWGLITLLGAGFGDFVRLADHWLALGLLGFLGLRMMREGLTRAAGTPPAPLAGTALVAMAIATSIDAAIAGVTLPAIGAPVLLACTVIGLVTAALSFAGVWLGRLIGVHLGRMAEVGGGVMLIALGAKIFVEHQFFGG